MPIIRLSMRLAIKLLVPGILFSACTTVSTSEPQVEEILQTVCFQEGDIAFREGRGWESRIIRMMDPHGTYTHAGIVTDSGGQWMVIHAVPNEPDFPGDIDRIKLEPVTAFFEKSRASHGEIKRITDAVKAQKAARIALHLYQKRTPFDHAYNDKDSTSMYCTELVDFSFRKAGISLTDEHDRKSGFSGFTGSYLFPSDLSKSSSLTSIFKF